MDSRIGELSAYSGKRVLITGHTGWKGAWLALWLTMLGADVIGYSPPVGSERRLYGDLGLDGLTRHEAGSILDAERLREVFTSASPEYVFHLAGQSKVGSAMADPVGAFELNALGTVNVLEACRQAVSVRSCLFVSSDRSYLGRDGVSGFRENDPTGGEDVYGASKAAGEFAVASYGRSFFSQRPLGWASVRTTNLIGGGDWSEGRIVPDCAAALTAGRPISLKSPKAIRPWMHVLDALRGYLLLGLRLACDPAGFSGAWNIGPDLNCLRPVRELAESYVCHRGKGEVSLEGATSSKQEWPSYLVNDKARLLLGWAQVWDFERTVVETASWHACEAEGGSLVDFSRAQVESHMAGAAE